MLLGFTGFYWVLQGFAGGGKRWGHDPPIGNAIFLEIAHRFLMAFHLIEAKFYFNFSKIGLDSVLLCFTGFYWVLLGFTGFCGGKEALGSRPTDWELNFFRNGPSLLNVFQFDE